MNKDVPDEIIGIISQAKPKEPEKPPVKPPAKPPEKAPVRRFIIAAVAGFGVLFAVYLVFVLIRFFGDYSKPQPVIITEPAKVQINIKSDNGTTTHIEYNPSAGNDIIEVGPDDEPTVILAPPRPVKSTYRPSEPAPAQPVTVRITQTKTKPEEKQQAAPQEPLKVSHGFGFFIGCVPKNSPKPGLNQ